MITYVYFCWPNDLQLSILVYELFRINEAYLDGIYSLYLKARKQVVAQSRHREVSCVDRIPKHGFAI